MIISIKSIGDKQEDKGRKPILIDDTGYKEDEMYLYSPPEDDDDDDDDKDDRDKD